jgi:hypothetical protein
MLELSKKKIFKILRNNKKKLKEYHVVKLGIFGSFLRNEDTTESDIDFIVEFEEGEKNFENYIELAFYLEDLLQRKIDLLTLEALSPYMKDKILKETIFEEIE